MRTYAVHPEDVRCILSTSGADEGKVVADLRVPVSEAREVGEMFAASPDMALALKAFLASGLNARWVDDESGKTVNVRRMAELALSKAGVQLP